MKRFSYFMIGVVVITILLITSSLINNMGKDEMIRGEEKIKIKFAMWDKNLQLFYGKVIDEFEELYPNIDVEMQIVDWDNYWNNIQLAAEVGTLPDVIWMNAPNVINFSEKSYIIPLDTYIKEDAINMNDYFSLTTDMYTVNDQLYAMPIFWDIICLWYNKDIFDAYGMPYPTSDWKFDDLLLVAEKFNNKEEDIWGLAVALDNEQSLYYNSIVQCGGYILSEDKKQSGFSSEATKNGIEVWYNLYKEGTIPYLKDDTDLAEYFKEGKAAMIYHGSWVYPELTRDEKIGDSIGIEALPAMEQEGTIVHGIGMAITSTTDYPDEAWLFIKYLSSKKVNDFFAKSGAGLSTYLPSLELFYHEEGKKGYNMNAFRDQLKDGVIYPYSQYTTEWLKVINENIDLIFQDELSVDEACDKIDKGINEVLEAERYSK
ncbi:ABC transporter substrate-binding protein [Vallitalea okinawensis]|uniref:ABC transporter substrate-binding protein n=1 Tax=Vallitalea okinawensis TaxID=2078660 RepID=UPI001300A75C|nr:sugar ABC transporter substrate-binding protein [Vallitalea okinawensis]